MEISFASLIVLAQIIPVLVLASYFDKEVLMKMSTYNKATKLSLIGIIFVIVIGEFIAIDAIAKGQGVDSLSGILVYIAACFALLNLLNIAGWRIFGLDLVSGMPSKKPHNKKRKK